MLLQKLLEIERFRKKILHPFVTGSGLRSGKRLVMYILFLIFGASKFNKMDTMKENTIHL